MKELLSIVGSLIVAVSFLPYLKDTIQKKIKPRIASWITWSLLTSTATVAAISAHAYTSALLTGSATIVEVLILAFALRNGNRTYQLLDGIAQSISLIGIILWLFSRDPVYGIAFNVMADFIGGGIPTYYHGWVKPHEEQWQSFMIFAFGSFLTIFGVSTHNFVNLAFPIYLTFNSSTIGLDIYFRQKVVKA
jgi:hypothetical protein